jgi:hypothetical protein
LGLDVVDDVLVETVEVDVLDASINAALTKNLLKIAMLVGHCHVARGLLFMSIDLSHKDDLIPIDLIHRKAIHVTNHGHIEWSFGGMWVRVVDVVAENFVVEGVVEGGEKLLVECFEDLGFDVGRVDALEGPVEHLEQDRVVVLVEGVHALYTHAVDDF